MKNRQVYWSDRKKQISTKIATLDENYRLVLEILGLEP